MTFQRQSLAGRDEDGTLRGGADRYDARGLLERLKEYTPEMREALKWTAAQWTGFMERYRDERKLPSAERKMASICNHSQEQLIMRAFGLGLELPTTHYPRLLETAPSLLQWCRDVLAYVVELEGLAETNERAIAGLEGQLAEAGRNLECSEGLFDGVQGQYEDMERQFKASETARQEERTRAESRERDLQRDLKASEEVCAAWKLTAQSNAAALGLLRREGFVEMEVATDGPQLPARRG